MLTAAFFFFSTLTWTHFFSNLASRSFYALLLLLSSVSVYPFTTHTHTYIYIYIYIYAPLLAIRFVRSTALRPTCSTQSFQPYIQTDVRAFFWGGFLSLLISFHDSKKKKRRAKRVFSCVLFLGVYSSCRDHLAKLVLSACWTAFFFSTCDPLIFFFFLSAYSHFASPVVTFSFPFFFSVFHCVLRVRVFAPHFTFYISEEEEEEEKKKKQHRKQQTSLVCVCFFFFNVCLRSDLSGKKKKWET